MSKKQELHGPTLFDVCQLAAERGVIIQIGVHPDDRERRPYRITINVYEGKPGGPHKAFQMDLLSTNPLMNAELGMRLMQWIDKVKPKRGLIIVGQA